MNFKTRSKEAPQLFLGLVKLVCKKHKSPPVVSLEIPTRNQTAVIRYLVSGDDSFFRSSDFFKSKVKDGRSSQAMVDLLSQLRNEKVSAVVCFDSSEARTSLDRETSMATNIQEYAKKFPEVKLIVLSGNVHSRIVEGTGWDPAYRPAAFELMKK